MRDGANVRSGPGSSHALITKLPRNTETTVLEVKPDQGGGALRWVRIRAGTLEGWMREDLLRFDASVVSFGLAQPGLYPASMNDRWWVRGYEGPQGHWGWDWGARVGEPVLCGPFGGLVIKSVECSRCTPDRPSFKEHGLQLGDSRGLSDPAWNFGYGHYVIVRYLNDHLPQATKQALAVAGLAGAHIYVIHAHLNSRAVGDNQQLQPNALIGTCGDTGNSEAAHLHLEMRASMNPNDVNWAGMKKNLLDPTILFYR
jgi:murein DD-endopeptidase MepM/ murein hydrolase activator NlpD